MEDFDRVREWANGHPREVLTRYAPATADALKGGRGPCPLHGGTDRNFSVTPGAGWYCHSQCGEGGDMVGLVQRLTGRDSKRGCVEVLRELAPVAGVLLAAPTMPTRRPRRAPVVSPAAPDAPGEGDPLAGLRAEGMFPATPADLHTLLLDALTLGPQGRAYLAGRGFDADAAAAYGFRSLESAAAWRDVETWLAASFTTEERTAAHVATLPGTYWPALVLPYRARAGGAVDGWRLRTLRPEGSPRYRSLAGFALPWPFNADALADLAGNVVHVVEGELNAYALHTHGLRAIGLDGAGKWRDTWGAALRDASRVVAWYDDDDAGQKGRAKLAAALQEANGRGWLEARGRVVTLADADPNDLHRRGELAAFLAQHRARWDP